MAIWEKNILGLVSQDEWLRVGLNVTRPNDPIDGLFGDEKTNNLFAKWQSLASEYQIPTMAQFHGFDTEAQKTIRVPVDNHNIEKGLIKVKLNLSERMRALINSGKVNFVASKDERGEIRTERLEQDEFASEETRKAFGREVGADFMLSGVLSSVVDQAGSKAVVFYQANLKLINIETNQIVWNGQKQIKKYVKRSKVSF